MKVMGSIWIEGRNSAFIGLGRVKLLEKIKEHGSITVAARAMKMSYRQAWELVDSMNKESSKPLVVAAAGGVGGGGTVVTPAGEKAIRDYKGLLTRFEKFTRNETAKLKS